MPNILGEIRMVAFDFAPSGWMKCEGQLLAISEFESLFYLLGTTYGGDGEVTMGLPNFCGATPIGFGDGYEIGQSGGEEFVKLTSAELPAHNHSVYAVTPGGEDINSPFEAYFSTAPTLYHDGGSNTQRVDMARSTIDAGPEALPHENRQPYMAVTYIICIDGNYPPVE